MQSIMNSINNSTDPQASEVQEIHQPDHIEEVPSIVQSVEINDQHEPCEPVEDNFSGKKSSGSTSPKAKSSKTSSIKHKPDQHKAGQHKPDQHKAGQHKPDQHKAVQHKDGQHKTDQHKAGQHKDGQHKDGQHKTDKNKSDIKNNDNSNSSDSNEDDSKPISDNSEPSSDDNPPSYEPQSDHDWYSYVFLQRGLVFNLGLLAIIFLASATVYYLYSLNKLSTMLKTFRNNTYVQPLVKSLPNIIWALLPAAIMVLLVLYLLRNGAALFSVSTISYFLTIYVIVLIMFISVSMSYNSKAATFLKNNPAQYINTIDVAVIQSYANLQSGLLFWISIVSGVLWAWIVGIRWVLSLMSIT